MAPPRLRPQRSSGDDADGENDPARNRRAAEDDDEHETAITTTTMSRGNMSRGGTSEALAIASAARMFEINERAKVDLVNRQIAEFAETLAVKLRARVAEDRARSRPDPLSSGANGSLAVGGGALAMAPALPALPLLSMFGNLLPTGSGGGGGLLATTFLVSMVTLSTVMGGAASPLLNMRTMLALMVVHTAQQTVRNAIADAQRRRFENLATQFAGPAAGRDDADVETERTVREVARLIATRHAAQIVPLSKQGRAALASVIVRRVTVHLRRARAGVADESRAPLVRSLQHVKWAGEDMWDRWMKPADRRRSRDTLPIMERVLRALTTERLPGDDTATLEFDPLFASSAVRIGDGARWTADGVLCRSGLRVWVRSPGSSSLPGSGRGAETEAFFAHDNSDVATYGFAFGSLSEARERGMSEVHPPDAKPVVSGPGASSSSSSSSVRRSKL